MHPRLRFWGWALGVAGGVAAAAALLLPYDALGLHRAAERERAWLLTVWTAGVLAILFGATARLGARGAGTREVAEAGSAEGAVETERRAGREYGRGFDAWLMATGSVLIVIYFIGWWMLR